MTKRPTSIPTPSMLQTYETTLQEYRTLLESYKQICARQAALLERAREDHADPQERAAWYEDEHSMDLTEALERVLDLFSDLIHVEDVVTLREVDRRHIQLVLSQARKALDDDSQPDFLRDESEAVQEAQEGV
jgi:hypothetical protein